MYESYDQQPTGSADTNWMLWFVGGIILLSVALIAGAALGKSMSGQTAPEFAGTNVHGDPIRLSEFKGQVVVLDFWATWCPPCVESVPKMKAFQAAYADQGVQVIGISGDHDKRALENFENENELNYPTIFGGAEDILRMYEIRAFPTLVVIDREGKIREVGHHLDLAAEVAPLL